MHVLVLFEREMLMDQNWSLLPRLGKRQEERGVSRKKGGNKRDVLLSYSSFRVLGLGEELQRAVA